MKIPTRRQREILDFIKGFIAEHKYPPTIREIASSFRISIKGAYDHVKALEKKNLIACDHHRSRAIEVLEKSSSENDVISVPILGHVAAGLPLFAEENNAGTITLPAAMVGNASTFALYVEGDSMTGAGIMDGDLAVFIHQAVAENGQIVVAMVGDAVTLKRFYKEKNRVRLQAENPVYPPLYSADVRILGRLLSIVRSY